MKKKIQNSIYRWKVVSVAPRLLFLNPYTAKPKEETTVTIRVVFLGLLFGLRFFIRARAFMRATLSTFWLTTIWRDRSRPCCRDCGTALSRSPFRWTNFIFFYKEIWDSSIEMSMISNLKGRFSWYFLISKHIHCLLTLVFKELGTIIPWFLRKRSLIWLDRFSTLQGPKRKCLLTINKAQWPELWPSYLS